MSERYYDLEIKGCQRRLPILNINDSLAIAAFVMLGDVELTEICADELLKKVPEGTQVLMTAATKGIPLTASLARKLGFSRYVVARKSVKAYMDEPLCVEDESITTAGKQRLYLMREDAELMRGKNVLLIDDVISTGGSMLAMRELVDLAGGKTVGEMAVLAEGPAADRDDIMFLAPLPLFKAAGRDGAL